MSLPPIRRTNASPPPTTLKLWFVIPPPSGSTDSTPPGQTRSTTSRVDHARMRSPARVEERLGRDLAGDPLAEDLDLDRLPGRGALGRQVRVGDRALDRVAVAAARHAADGLAVDAHRLGAERDRARVGEHEAAEPALRLRPREQRLAADEVALVELDGEAEPGLERRVVGRDVGAPDAVALLEPQRVDRLVAAGDEAVLAARLPDRVPEREPELRRAVELPAELADVGDAQREARHRADRELARAHVREVERRRRQRLQDLARLRPPEAEAGVGGGDVVDGDAVGRVLADPGEVVLAERGAGDDAEALLARAA